MHKNHSHVESNVFYWTAPAPTGHIYFMYESSSCSIKLTGFLKFFTRPLKEHLAQNNERDLYTTTKTLIHLNNRLFSCNIYMRRKKEIKANQSHVYQINSSVLSYNMHSILFLLKVLLLHKKNYKLKYFYRSLLPVLYSSSLVICICLETQKEMKQIN